VAALAKKWFDRADASFKSGDVEDAQTAVESALHADQHRPEIRLLAARIALSRLEYAQVLTLLKGVEGTEASSIRGRALWYSGDVEQAADELERLVADPEVRDPWAADIAKLSRRGIGRKPFAMTGGMVAVSEMPRVGTAALIVPLEISGEPALGLIATGTAEVVLDASKGTEPTWVSMRFGDKIEVHDVPALSKDLSGISRQVNAPIRALLGVNLLRHLHPTFDFMGGQFRGAQLRSAATSRSDGGEAQLRARRRYAAARRGGLDGLAGASVVVDRHFDSVSGRARRRRLEESGRAAFQPAPGAEPGHAAPRCAAAVAARCVRRAERAGARR